MKLELVMINGSQQKQNAMIHRYTRKLAKLERILVHLLCETLSVSKDLFHQGTKSLYHKFFPKV